MIKMQKSIGVYVTPGTNDQLLNASLPRQIRNRRSNALIQSVQHQRFIEKEQSYAPWAYEAVIVNNFQEEQELISNLEWRQCTSLPVRKVKSYRKQLLSESHSVSVNFPKRFIIEIEPIQMRLSSLKNIQLSEALYLITECLVGYQALSYRSTNQGKLRNDLNSTISLLEDCGINKKGQCRIGIKLRHNNIFNINPEFIIEQLISSVSQLVEFPYRRELLTLGERLRKIHSLTFKHAQSVTKQFARERALTISQQINLPRISTTRVSPQPSYLKNSPTYCHSNLLRSNGAPYQLPIMSSPHRPQFSCSPPPFIATKKSLVGSVGPKITWNYLSSNGKAENLSSLHGAINSGGLYENMRSSYKLNPPMAQNIPSQFSCFIPNAAVTSSNQKVQLCLPERNTSDFNCLGLQNVDQDQQLVQQFSISKEEEETVNKCYQVQPQIEDRNYKKSQRLSITPQYSIKQHQENRISFDIHKSANKSIKTTQCSGLRSTRFDQISSCSESKYGQLLGSTQMKESVYKDSVFMDQKYRIKRNIEKLDLGQNAQSIFCDRPLSSDRQSIVECHYNFGGLFPEIKANSGESQQSVYPDKGLIARPNSQTNCIPNLNKIMSSVCENEDNVIISQYIDNPGLNSFEGWTNSVKLLTDNGKQDLKESVYCGEETFSKQLTLDLTKLSKLGKLGRMIGKSVIPDNKT